MRSIHVVLASILAAACLAGSGCLNVHPQYRTDDVVWDDTLVGEWLATGEDGKPIRLVIEPRDVEVDPQNNRINPTEGFGVRVRRGGTATEPPPPLGHMQQYLLGYRSPDDGTHTWTLEGYLLRAGEHRFLAFQIHDPFIDANAGLVVPVHMLWRVEITGDSLSFWSPKDAVAWIPGIEWADAPDDGGDRPIPLRTGSPRGIRVAESLDRVLAYHIQHADDPDFWHQDSSMLFHRR